MLARLDWEDLLEQFASASPAPGGGSAAALAGAVGAALAGMVARITARRAAGPGGPGEMEALTHEAERLMGRLSSLVEEDARAFEAVMEARRLPKGTPGEAEHRRETLARARALAAGVPLEVAEACVSVLELLARLARLGATPSVATDLGVGALLARAGVEGAALNVLVNLTPAERGEEGPVGLKVRGLQARAAELASLATGWVAEVLGEKG